MATNPDNASVPPFPELMARTGATIRQIYHWAGAAGYLHPVRRYPDRGDGSGSPRFWPDSEIEVARQMVTLIKAGLSPAAAHHAARNRGLLPGGQFQVTAVERIEVAA